MAPSEAARKARRTPVKQLDSATRLVDDKSEQAALWTLREAALAATAHVPDMPETWPGWEDSAVPREKLGDYLRDLKALFHKYGYEASVYGHFGDGLIHCRIPFRPADGSRASTTWQRFLDEAADLVVALWRLAVRRTWRRSGARRPARPHVSARHARRLRRVQGDLGPGQPHESRQGRRAIPGHLQPARRARATSPKSPTTISPIARTAAASPRRRGAASVSAPAAAVTAAKASCARATGQPARRNIRRAAARTCCSRCCMAAPSMTA